MNREDLERRLPEYLGDELPEADAVQFEATLVEHPDLAADVDSLRRTISALRRLDPVTAVPQIAPVTINDRPGAAAIAPPRARAASRPRLLRAAAVVLLSFVAGYVVRSATEPADIAPARPIEDAAGVEAWANARGQALTRWEARTAEAWSRQHGTSGLARSLLAVAGSGSADRARHER